MTMQERIRRLNAQAQQYRIEVRQRLMHQLNSGNPRAFSHGLDRGGDKFGGAMNAQRGGMEMKYGVTPSDADIDQYIQMNGGNPYTSRMQSLMSQSSGQRARKPSREESDADTLSPSEMFEKVASQWQEGRERARQENLARYDEGKALYTDVGQRNQERVKNWGLAAQDDIDERMKEAVSEAAANAASHGLSNSNVVDAYRVRAARDTAREQQRVSEMRDSRASEYDTRDTGNLAGFIERRNDTSDDIGQLMQLAEKFGQSGDGEGLRKVQNELANLRKSINRPRQYSTGQAQRYGPLGIGPIFLNGNPMQMAQSMFSGWGGGGQRFQLRDRSEAKRQGSAAGVAAKTAALPLAAVPAITGGPIGGMMGLIGAAALNQGQRRRNY